MTGIRSPLFAREQIASARAYTLSLLEGLHDDDWFCAPAGCATHIAWQVGHLAMAEYGLALFRRRGRRESDMELMSSQFRKQFARGSAPALARDDNPPRSEIVDVFKRVHEQTLAELAACQDDLAEAVAEPYAVEPTKFGALLFCAHHEMLHAGQIGLLRRLLGKPPVR